MTDLYFPQLSTGALSQYPIRKTRIKRAIKNLLADGSVLVFEDAGAARCVWQLAYQGISGNDLAALQAHFAACSGPFHGFTFIDPVENMLVSSSDLMAAVWQNPGQIQITPGAADPEGGSAAVTLTNTGQTTQTITQTLQVPSFYQYCFSVFVSSSQTSKITLTRAAAATSSSDVFASGPAWQRIVSSGKLSDSGYVFTVGISLQAGQQIEVYGMQLEAQQLPSRYRPTAQTGGVWPNAHWGVELLSVVAEAPDQFSTSFTIETAV